MVETLAVADTQKKAKGGRKSKLCTDLASIPKASAYGEALLQGQELYFYDVHLLPKCSLNVP